MPNRRYGDWSKLTTHLLADASIEVTLTDDELQRIAGAVEEKRPYYIDFTDPNYCIRRRASDAGYQVDYHPGDKSIKVFTKQMTA